MSAKRKHRSPYEYLKYLKGELSREERYSFERDLEADQFEMEALEGMAGISTGELEEDLLSLHDTLRKRLNRRKRRTFYSLAASIASLLIVGTVFLNIYNINPKTAEESTLREEHFMQEEVNGQAEEAKIQAEEPVPQETRARKTDAVIEDAPDLEPEVVPEERGLQAAEVKEEAKAPVQQAAEPLKMEADELVADELVVMEAQPKRSQKKGRALETPAPVSAQRVKGIVVSSEDMEPLPGASILVKGSDSGMVADMEGRFSLQTDQPSKTTVIASYVGMETEEYQLAGGIENQVVMQPDPASVNELVVIGYDTDKSMFTTGAVQQVTRDEEEFTYSGAEPEGGLQAYKMYIEEQIRFPAGDTLSNREVVVLKFHVDRDGTISNIQTLRSPDESFTKEAIRLLQKGPAWNPARNESGATDDVVRMRIIFKR